LITAEIIVHVKSDRFFTILADETTDIKKQEQMAIEVRFSDSKTLQIWVEFIEFAIVEDL
ncbi:hypothetical protein QYM36_011012, partial [Artemia franciscana]